MIKQQQQHSEQQLAVCEHLPFLSNTASVVSYAQRARICIRIMMTVVMYFGEEGGASTVMITTAIANYKDDGDP